MYLAVAIRCLEMNLISGALGDQGQGPGLTEKIFFHFGKVLLQMLFIIPDSRAVQFNE